MAVLMNSLNDLNPQYIIDENGEKKSVILSIADFEEILADLEDLAAIAERKDEPTISHEDLHALLKKDGLL